MNFVVGDTTVLKQFVAMVKNIAMGRRHVHREFIAMYFAELKIASKANHAKTTTIRIRYLVMTRLLERESHRKILGLELIDLVEL